MWSRTFCCCAVPLYNSGIYAILAQFLIISTTAGVLSFAAPTIVAVAIPSFLPFLFGALCLVLAAFQVVGFLGVYKERPNLFKNYARLNVFLVSSVLAIALASIIVSAVKHTTAVANCEALFSSQIASPSSGGLLSGIATGNVTSASGICEIWTWVQLGIMGALFLIVTLCEAYFLMYQSIYLSEQKADHARYDSVYSTAEREIRESGLWDHHDINHPGAGAGAGAGQDFSRPSTEEISDYRQYGQGHGRTGSVASGLRNEVGGGTAGDFQSQEYLSQPQYRDGDDAEKGYRDYEENGYRNEKGMPRSEGSWNVPYRG